MTIDLEIRLRPIWLFYRLSYKELDTMSGYFLLKRKWVWIILSPITLPILILLCCIEIIISYFLGLNDYDLTCHCASKNIKLNRKQRNYIKKNLY